MTAPGEPSPADEERVRSLFKDITDIIVVVDEQGTILYGSNSALTVLGHRPENFVGRNVFTLVHPDDLDYVAGVFVERALVQGPRSPIQFRALDGDGHWRWVETITTFREEPTGKTVLITVRDISERKRSEEELQAKTAELERSAAELAAANHELRGLQEAADRANRAKSDFLSRMSHELRTPLNSVLGFGQLLKLQVPDADADAQESVDHILRGGRHLLNLINEVLDITRIESGVLALSLEAVDVAAVAAEAADVLRPEAAERGIVVDVVPPPADATPAHVRADCQRLLQVLINLVANAVKYNRAGGTVTVTVAPVGDDRLAVAVRDTGPGIRPEHLDRLFVPFDRLDAGTSSVEGTGIGLSIAKALIDQMHGSVTVESTVGEGSRFTVTMPRADEWAAAAVTLPIPGERPDDHGGLRVLYIEDNPVNFRLVQQALATRPGVELLGAGSGADGLRMAASAPPDLILLDLNLPDVPGLEVLRRLQADPATASIPVTVVTADATPGRDESVARAGAAGYLTKPLDLRELLRLIDTAAGSSGSTPPAN